MLHMSIMHSYLLLSIVSFDGYATICLAIRQLRDIWVISSFETITNREAINFCVQVFV